MSEIIWDELEDRFFEHGVDHGVLYDSQSGAYVNGVAWNGLTAVTESPSGAEPNKQYADNIVYVNLMSAEEFSATIEAFMAPDEFDKHNGIYRSESGVQYGQQRRKAFGFSWRSGKGNAVDEDLGYILHLAYGCQASPSEKNYTTKNDSPEPATFSWSLSTTPVNGGPGRKPVAVLHIDSTDPTVNPTNLAALEAILYGTPGNAPRLPLPAEVETIMSSGATGVTPEAPTFDGVNTVTIPAVVGVDYVVNGQVVEAGPLEITVDTVVEATPEPGYTFTGTFVTAWLFEVA